jgi:sigma-B regulation protein RsbU (phosphoserine phosphatase)
MAATKSKRLKLVNFKLNSLLNITRAINELRDPNQLLERYENILRNDLGIGKIVVFKHVGKEWKQILSSGISEEDKVGCLSIDVENDLLQYDDISFVTSSPNPLLKYIDIILPVIKNEKPLAFVLIGDIEEEMEGVSPTIKHLRFIQTLSNIIIVAIENIRLFNESLRQEAIKKELELASKMQNMLIPDLDNLPDNEFISVDAFYRPHYEIGGDYYDVVTLDDDLIGFCIADVSGKGISAALLVSNFQANLRALFNAEIPLANLIGILNERVVSSAKGEKFITFFAARYNYRTGYFEYINAGHNPPLFYDKKTKKLTYLNKGCAGIGMLEEIPIIKMGHFTIDNPSKLFCYTDGLVEFISEEGIEYSNNAIENIFSNKLPVDKNIEAIIKHHNITEGSDAIIDDISILGVDFTGKQKTS